MPGIFGIIGKASPQEKPVLLRRMLDCMTHEKFYRTGTYINEQLGVYLGWATHPDSFSDCMPLWNETRDICLIYYGENFPEKGLVERLLSQGHAFEAGNASYLVHLYEEEESRFCELLNGWFSGVVIDQRKRRVLLFNDRYGMQRIYYHEGHDCLYFSSEAKALLKVHPRLRKLDQRSLGEFFSFDCVLEDRSLFTDVHLLPPASVWISRAGVMFDKHRYFLPEQWERQPSLQKDDFYRTLREKFAEILPKYLGERIGLSLTGGLDTRLIMAWANVPGGKLPCYTFGGMYHDCFDVKISRTVAKLCNQTHQVLAVDRDFLAEFPALAEKTVYLSDGNQDVTGAADLFVNRMARDIAPVRLTGNYGSEIIRGARHLKAQPAPPGLFVDTFAKEIAAAADTLQNAYHGHPVSFAAFKQVPWFQHNRLALEQSQLTLRSPYLDNDLVRLMYQAPAEVLKSNELSLRLINDGNPHLANIMTDRGIGGNRGKLSSTLAHCYREFLFKTDYAFDYGMPRCCATIDRYLFAPLHVEKAFLGRHKFYHFRVWYRDELSRYVKEILLDRKSLERSYLCRTTAEKMVLDHTCGRQNYTTEITRLLTVELLQRLLLD